MMKKIITLIIWGGFLVFPWTMNAQQAVTFSYDNAGNMISRVINLPLKNTRKVIDTLPKSEKENELFNDQINNYDITIRPNPTDGELKVEIPNYEYSRTDLIEVYGINGELIKQIRPLQPINTIDLSKSPVGIYILNIIIGEEKVQWKIIKQ